MTGNLEQLRLLNVGARCLDIFLCKRCDVKAVARLQLDDHAVGHLGHKNLVRVNDLKGVPPLEHLHRLNIDAYIARVLC